MEDINYSVSSQNSFANDTENYDELEMSVLTSSHRQTQYQYQPLFESNAETTDSLNNLQDVIKYNRQQIYDKIEQIEQNVGLTINKENESRKSNQARLNGSIKKMPSTPQRIASVDAKKNKKDNPKIVVTMDINRIQDQTNFLNRKINQKKAGFIVDQRPLKQLHKIR